MISKKLTMAGLAAALVLAGCTSTPSKKLSAESFLKKDLTEANVSTEVSTNSAASEQVVSENENLSYLSTYSSVAQLQQEKSRMLTHFSETEMVKVTADGLELNNYLHYVLGELLGVSYVLGEGVEKESRPITLNLQEDISERKLFLLSQDLLNERGYLVRYDDDIFYIQQQSGNSNQAEKIFSYGASVNDVPETTLDIIQMVPFFYGTQTSIGPLINRFVNVKSTMLPQREMMLIEGKRRDIVRALEFIKLMDRPLFQNREIGLYKPTYVSLDAIKTSIADLMAQEGITLSEKGRSNAISMISLDRMNTIIFFSNKKSLIERAVFWANQLDEPSDIEEEQYFIYSPQFSRAVDLGDSLKLLIGDSDGSAPSSSTSAAQQNEKAGGRGAGGFSASNEDIKMVVDELSNTLIFRTTGKEYKSLMPLIKRLDVMPKQIALEVLIAEVTLTDRFRKGVEFALSKGNYSFGTAGALGARDFGGLSYILTGASGSITMNLFQSDSLVNVISRPSLVVRDGVSANINVGNDIPIIGETTIDPNDSTSIARTSIEYRKTGVKLDVTPTVNAQGVVTLSIKQSISNQLSDVSTVSGSPAIFERSISTEVVAADGQTVVLGGLISENTSEGSTRVPVLSDIPLLGNLFRADNDTGEKTELVVMVTARIIENSEEWEDLKRNLGEKLNEIQIN